MKYFGLLFLWYVIVPADLRAQTYVIDRLLKKVHHAKTDEEKLQAILSLSDEYKNISRDTLDKYAYLGKKLAKSSADSRSKGLAELTMAYMYMRWGWVDSTLASIQEGLRFSSSSDPATRDIYFKLLRQKAITLGAASRYREALDVLYPLITLAEKVRDTVTLGTNLNTIGSVSLARYKPREALPWLSRAMRLSPADKRYDPVLSAIYINMAMAYSQLSLIDSADFYISRGIALCKKDGDLTTLAVALQRQSDIFVTSRRLASAERALKEMLSVRQKLGDSDLWLDDNLSLINFYINTNQVDKAIDFCKDHLHSGNLLEKNEGGYRVLANNIKLRLNYYEALARCYKIKGDNDLYQQSLENIIAAKDSLYEANSANAIEELQARYEVQKKENTIIQQRFDLLKKDYLFYGSLLALVFVVVISYLLFRNYRHRQHIRLEYMQQEEKRIASQAVQEAEEKERKRISRDLHDNLGAYAASLGSNIDRLSRNVINQESLAPLLELRNNSQAIVSMLNDTIWVLQKDTYSLTAIGDRVKLFVQRLQPSYPDVTFSFYEDLADDPLLSPSQAFHLFQIIGEAINNALKHSKASQIQITITNYQDTADWSVEVTDDGIGVNASILNRYGNGMNNMRTRAAECGWRIEWTENKPRGTRVTVLK